jgi:hypothetical protein
MKSKNRVPSDDRRYNSDKRVQSAGVKVQSQLKAGGHVKVFDGGSLAEIRTF